VKPRGDIWAQQLQRMLELAQRNGLAMAPLVEGMPFDAVSVRRLKWVAWDDFCRFCERFESQAGGPEAAQRLLENAFERLAPEMTMLAAALMSPKALYQFVFEVLHPIMLPPLEFTYTDLGVDHLRIVSRVRPEFRPCPALMRLSTGAMRGLTRCLGMPSARVEADLDGREITFEVHVPPSRTIPARLRRSSRAAIDRVLGLILLGDGGDNDGTALGASLHGLAADDLEARIEAATRELKLTTRQADVLTHLIRGRANKEIAQALGCAEVTVEQHVTHLLRKAGVGSRTQLIAFFLPSQ
jgi:DNA-binding CsgD family transcriptional regulator